MEVLAQLIRLLRTIVWGPGLVLTILAVGLYLTIRLRGVQFRGMGQAIHGLLRPSENGSGDVSSFGALCTALAATIGTGNIVGVAVAIRTGGPGALFWMLLAALLGMATQYTEGLLAVKYRGFDRHGQVVGGPFLYIQNGLGKKWRPLARLFAFFAVIAGLFGMGTVTQSHCITSAVQSFFDPALRQSAMLLGREYSHSAILAGLIVTILTALVLVGGAKRIMRVASGLVPFMAAGYAAVNLLLLVCNLEKIPRALLTILHGAFSPAAVTGGAVGSVIVAAGAGIARGVFTNEAGMGTTAIAAAAARTDSPVRQGLVSMTGTLIDTIVLCTMTGLSVVVTGAWDRGLEGVAISSYAFSSGLPFSKALSEFLLMLSLCFFAFATIVGWFYYAERCLAYLSNDNPWAARIYRWAYVLAVLAGPYLTLDVVWDLADLTNGLMVIPNLIALLLLSGVAARETEAHFRN